MYDLIFTEAAENDLARLDHPIRQRILARLTWLCEHADITTLETMTGNWAGLFKLRVGDYRILYDIDRQERLILVHILGHRRNIYR